MKAILIILLFLVSFQGFSQVTDTSLVKLQETILTQQIAIEKLEKKDATTKASTEKDTPCLDCKPDLGYMWLYILMPVILSFGAAFYFISWLKREGYKISNALSDDVPEQRLQQAQTVQADLVRARADLIAINAADPANAQAVPPPVVADQSTIPMNRSSSRLIAFLSSMSASVLAICIFSYYMYFAIQGMPVPKFEELWPILTALGLGIVPYATKVMNEKSNSVG